MIAFARDVLHEPLDPWQQHAVIRIGELLPDGRPRFRRLLLIVARQNGKTHLLKVLALYWLFVERQPMVFGTSTDRDQAKESWDAAVQLAENTAVLASRLPRSYVRRSNGQETFATVHRTRYRIGAANRNGGRGKTINRLIGDELREHRTWEAYYASYPALSAVPTGQAVFISNQGDAGSIVLNALRDEALSVIRGEGGDPRLGLLEWSAPEGSHPADPAAWAAANPQLGRRMDHETIAGPAAGVARPGVDPEQLAKFLTEILCMNVPNMDPALSIGRWNELAEPGGLADLRGRLAACLDVSPAGARATLTVAALLDDGRARVEAVHTWLDLEQMRRELPAMLATIRPARFGWFPGGPAAAVDADLRDRRAKDKRRRAWPPPGLHVQELSAGEVAAVCMGFAEQIMAGRIVHSGQDALDVQIARAEKIATGDRWVFGSKTGTVEMVYAAAGAVHLARTMPKQRTVSRRARGTGGFPA